MNIDLHWLSDDALAAIGRREASTPFGRVLLHQWAGRDRRPLSSDTYRGCVIALAAVHRESTTKGATILAVRRIVEELGRSLPVSRHLPAGTLRQRGAVWALATARRCAACSGSAAQAIALFECEMIYAARRHAAARHEELAAFALV